MDLQISKDITDKKFKNYYIISYLIYILYIYLFFNIIAIDKLNNIKNMNKTDEDMFKEYNNLNGKKLIKYDETIYKKIILYLTYTYFHVTKFINELINKMKTMFDSVDNIYEDILTNININKEYFDITELQKFIYNYNNEDFLGNIIFIYKLFKKSLLNNALTEIDVKIIEKLINKFSDIDIEELSHIINIVNIIQNIKEKNIIIEIIKIEINKNTLINKKVTEETLEDHNIIYSNDYLNKESYILYSHVEDYLIQEETYNLLIKLPDNDPHSVIIVLTHIGYEWQFENFLHDLPLLSILYNNVYNNLIRSPDNDNDDNIINYIKDKIEKLLNQVYNKITKNTFNIDNIDNSERVKEIINTSIVGILLKLKRFNNIDIFDLKIKNKHDFKIEKEYNFNIDLNSTKYKKTTTDIDRVLALFKYMYTEEQFKEKFNSQSISCKNYINLLVKQERLLFFIYNNINLTKENIIFILKIFPREIINTTFDIDDIQIYKNIITKVFKDFKKTVLDVSNIERDKKRFKDLDLKEKIERNDNLINSKESLIDSYTESPLYIFNNLPLKIRNNNEILETIYYYYPDISINAKNFYPDIWIIRYIIYSIYKFENEGIHSITYMLKIIYNENIEYILNKNNNCKKLLYEYLQEKLEENFNKLEEQKTKEEQIFEIDLEKFINKIDSQNIDSLNIESDNNFNKNSMDIMKQLLKYDFNFEKLNDFKDITKLGNKLEKLKETLNKKYMYLKSLYNKINFDNFQIIDSNDFGIQEFNDTVLELLKLYKYMRNAKIIKAGKLNITELYIEFLKGPYKEKEDTYKFEKNITDEDHKNYEIIIKSCFICSYLENDWFTNVNEVMAYLFSKNDIKQYIIHVLNNMIQKFTYIKDVMFSYVSKEYKRDVLNKKIDLLDDINFFDPKNPGDILYELIFYYNNYNNTKYESIKKKLPDNWWKSEDFKEVLKDTDLINNFIEHIKDFETPEKYLLGSSKLNDNNLLANNNFIKAVLENNTYYKLFKFVSIIVRKDLNLIKNLIEVSMDIIAHAEFEGSYNEEDKLLYKEIENLVIDKQPSLFEHLKPSHSDHEAVLNAVIKDAELFKHALKSVIIEDLQKLNEDDNHMSIIKTVIEKDCNIFVDVMNDMLEKEKSDNLKEQSDDLKELIKQLEINNELPKILFYNCKKVRVLKWKPRESMYNDATYMDSPIESLNGKLKENQKQQENIIKYIEEHILVYFEKISDKELDKIELEKTIEILINKIKNCMNNSSILKDFKDIEINTNILEKDTILAIIKGNTNEYKHLSEDMKNDKTVIETVLENGINLIELPMKILYDIKNNFIVNIIKENSVYILLEPLLGSGNIINKLVKRNDVFFSYILNYVINKNCDIKNILKKILWLLRYHSKETNIMLNIKNSEYNEEIISMLKKFRNTADSIFKKIEDLKMKKDFICNDIFIYKEKPFIIESKYNKIFKILRYKDFKSNYNPHIIEKLLTYFSMKDIIKIIKYIEEVVDNKNILLNAIIKSKAKYSIESEIQEICKKDKSDSIGQHLILENDSVEWNFKWHKFNLDDDKLDLTNKKLNLTNEELLFLYNKYNPDTLEILIEKVINNIIEDLKSEKNKQEEYHNVLKIIYTKEVVSISPDHKDEAIAKKANEELINTKLLEKKIKKGIKSVLEYINEIEQSKKIEKLNNTKDITTIEIEEINNNFDNTIGTFYKIINEIKICDPTILSSCIVHNQGKIPEFFAYEELYKKTEILAKKDMSKIENIINNIDKLSEKFMIKYLKINILRGKMKYYKDELEKAKKNEKSATEKYIEKFREIVDKNIIYIRLTDRFLYQSIDQKKRIKDIDEFKKIFLTEDEYDYIKIDNFSKAIDKLEVNKKETIEIEEWKRKIGLSEVNRPSDDKLVSTLNGGRDVKIYNLNIIKKLYVESIKDTKYKLTKIIEIEEKIKDYKIQEETQYISKLEDNENELKKLLNKAKENIKNTHNELKKFLKKAEENIKNTHINEEYLKKFKKYLEIKNEINNYIKKIKKIKDTHNQFIIDNRKYVQGMETMGIKRHKIDLTNIENILVKYENEENEETVSSDKNL